MKGLENKVSVITGAATGIGRAVAYRLAEEKGYVIIADINGKAGDIVAENLVRKGYRAIAIQTDVSKERAVKKLMRKCDSSYGRIDFLVNNAADFTQKGIDASVKDWRKVMDTNILGYALCTKHSVPYMRSGGAIVNISSISALVAQPDFVTYSTTKGAIISMNRCLARDFAPKIRVNTVSPGVVLTENAIKSISKNYGLLPEQIDQDPRFGGLHLLKRCAKPEEIASAVVFLLSDDASFIDGQNLIVDGGLTAKGPF